MELWQNFLHYLQNNIFHNPISWAIAAVVLWIIGAGFVKGWRAKHED